MRERAGLLGLAFDPNYSTNGTCTCNTLRPRRQARNSVEVLLSARPTRTRPTRTASWSNFRFPSHFIHQPPRRDVGSVPTATFYVGVGDGAQERPLGNGQNTFHLAREDPAHRREERLRRPPIRHPADGPFAGKLGAAARYGPTAYQPLAFLLRCADGPTLGGRRGPDVMKRSTSSPEARTTGGT